MIKKMVHRRIAQIHIQFNVFYPQQPALSAHFEQCLFPNPFLNTMALFISLVGCWVHQDIPLIAISSELGIRVPIDLGISNKPVGPFDSE